MFPSLDQPTAKSRETWSWRRQPVTTRGQQSQRPGQSWVPRCWASERPGWPAGPIFAGLCTLPATHPELAAAPLCYRVTPRVGQDTQVPGFSLSVTLGKVPRPRPPGAQFPSLSREAVGGGVSDLRWSQKTSFPNVEGHAPASLCHFHKELPDKPSQAPGGPAVPGGLSPSPASQAQGIRCAPRQDREPGFKQSLLLSLLPFAQETCRRVGATL